eukprot:NODE_302_length_11399_cov_0.339115.p1 type:complete len:547 gc:universal NODE_302_length_11399_cov_0.339115:7001-5361(-)
MLLSNIALAAVQLLFSKTLDNDCKYLRTNNFPHYRGILPKQVTYRNMMEITADDTDSALLVAKKHCATLDMKIIVQDEEAPLLEDVDYELQSIITSGNPDNRIDVVFMGDGYTKSERTKFFNDIKRLVDEMWNGQTFKPLLPMFNIWALYIPSVDSGISFMQYSKNTVFGLRRDGNELRGIMPGKANFARQLCNKLGTKCDYPSIIGNDVFYGGLGGEFVISTSSATTGTTVLRHEMGHNFATEGEEYDDGYVYSGYNSARSIGSIQWSHWVASKIDLENKLNMLATEHPWASLDNPYILKFKTNSNYNYWKLLISLSGVENAESVRVSVDEIEMPLESKGTLDRQFYFWKFTKPLAVGTHELRIEQLKKPLLRDPRTGEIMGRTVCSLDIHEYERNVFDEYESVGAFPTWDIRGRKSYRPTNDLCIMRNMTSPRFCPVCMEGMHINFLQKIRLIDSLNVTCTGNTGNALLSAVPYGQFSKLKQKEDTFYDIIWKKEGQVQDTLTDKQRVENLTPGAYEVSLKFNTPHVRLNLKYLTDRRTFTVAC